MNNKYACITTGTASSTYSLKIRHMDGGHLIEVWRDGHMVYDDKVHLGDDSKLQAYAEVLRNAVILRDAADLKNLEYMNALDKLQDIKRSCYDASGRSTGR
jgi:hypothetical protein